MRDDNDDRYIEKLESENARLHAEQDRLQQVEAKLASHTLLLEGIRRELIRLSKGLGVY